MKYSKEIANKFIEMFADGKHSIQDICGALNIHRDTYYDWKNKIKAFSQKLETAEKRRLDSIADLAESSLIKLISEREFEESKQETIYGLDKAGKPIKKGYSVTTTKKVIMPVPSMVALTLTNRKPDVWKNKQDIKLDGEVKNITVRIE